MPTYVQIDKSDMNIIGNFFPPNILYTHKYMHNMYETSWLDTANIPICLSVNLDFFERNKFLCEKKNLFLKKLWIFFPFNKLV